MNVLQSPNNDKWMAEIFPKSDDKEYQDIFQIAQDTVQEQGNIEADEIVTITENSTVQVVLQIRNSCTHVLRMWIYSSWIKCSQERHQLFQ